MKRGLLIVGLVVVVGLGYWAQERFFQHPQIEVLETARAEVATIRGVLVATGIIKPQVGALVKIGARATGAIEKMMVKVGDPVEKGELIARIDQREIQEELAVQKAALERAEAGLAQTEQTYPKRIREAKANYDFARINYVRETRLLRNEYTTKNDVDRARSDSEAKQAIYQRLQDEYLTEVRMAKAQVAEISARIGQQQVRLSYTRIYAPIDGIVSEVTAQEGETIVTGLQVANLVSVFDPTRLEMWIYVDETDVGRVVAGQEAEYYVDTYPDKIFHGKIEAVRPQPVVKDNIVYYLAIVKIGKEDARFLKPEMTSYVRIIYDERTGILALPNSAIKYEKGKQIVYRVSAQGKVDQVDVRIGLRGEDKTQIVGGLQEGEEVATKLVLPVAKANGK